jgi:hypothetical protein
MAAKNIDLDQIIEVVSEANPGSALDRVGGAREMAARLETLSQHVIAHFVEEARQGGASWTQIGSALGVTRQAAQQRFVPSDSADLAAATARSGLPYAARATSSLESARTLASDHGHSRVEDAHVLLGLLENRTGVAISALKALGVRTADLRKAARAELPGDTKRKTANPALGRSSVKALELAEREALRLGSAAVDTEHVLLGLLGDSESTVAKAFAAAGQDYAAVRQAVAREGAAERPAKKAAKRGR